MHSENEAGSREQPPSLCLNPLAKGRAKLENASEQGVAPGLQLGRGILMLRVSAAQNMLQGCSVALLSAKLEQRQEELVSRDVQHGRRLVAPAAAAASQLVGSLVQIPGHALHVQLQSPAFSVGWNDCSCLHTMHAEDVMEARILPDDRQAVVQRQSKRCSAHGSQQPITNAEVWSYYHKAPSSSWTFFDQKTLHPVRQQSVMLPATTPWKTLLPEFQLRRPSLHLVAKCCNFLLQIDHFQPSCGQAFFATAVNFLLQINHCQNNSNDYSNNRESRGAAEPDLGACTLLSRPLQLFQALLHSLVPRSSRSNHCACCCRLRGAWPKAARRCLVTPSGQCIHCVCQCETLPVLCEWQAP
mmetsp:Transcript_40390/g.75561  ORF Transcript_40390/g.75561 Transcript_40390/m.75561 type:complete len:357 (-) Transcript_40390:104-1174(-)